MSEFSKYVLVRKLQKALIHDMYHQVMTNKSFLFIFSPSQYIAFSTLHDFFFTKKSVIIK